MFSNDVSRRIVTGGVTGRNVTCYAASVRATSIRKDNARNETDLAHGVTYHARCEPSTHPA